MSLLPQSSEDAAALEEEEKEEESGGELKRSKSVESVSEDLINVSITWCHVI